MTTTGLLASYWTIAGPIRPLGGSEISPWDIRERIRVAAETGFTGVGFSHADLMAWARELGFPAIRRTLEDHGIKRCEYESLFDWWADGQRRVASDRARADLLRAVEELGAPQSHIKCGPDLLGASHETDIYAEAFSVLAEECERAGARVGLESFPFSDIDRPSRALDVVLAAGNANGGLILDIWHVVRGGVTFGEISAIPGEWIVHVEIDDADAEPFGALLDDTVDRRRLCGDGAFDIPSFVAAIRATGYEGLLGVEVISEEQRARPLGEAAALAYQTAARALADL
jgi:sugar phosphate isomerase/epimerase